MTLNKNTEKTGLDECVNTADILARARALYPQHPALIIADRTWSYRELGSLVDATALRLKKIVTEDGGRIAIVGGNHLSYIAAYWGAQSLGFSTVEINRNESLQTVIGILNAPHDSSGIRNAEYSWQSYFSSISRSGKLPESVAPCRKTGCGDHNEPSSFRQK
jgi:acyl-CoA synthetase (AMP-forming)/AMP-acid ligase II